MRNREKESKDDDDEKERKRKKKVKNSYDPIAKGAKHTKPIKRTIEPNGSNRYDDECKFNTQQVLLKRFST